MIGSEILYYSKESFEMDAYTLMTHTKVRGLKGVALSILLSLLLLSIGINCLAASITLNPDADAYVMAITPDSNYGSEVSVTIGGTDPEVLAYVKFNLSSIPSGSIINDAKLHLYCTTIFDNGPVGIALAESAWAEGEVTWNNRPGPEHPVVTSTPPGSSQWWEIPVTSIVKKWIEDGASNRGFRLEKLGSGFIQFYSREFPNNNPELEISYTPPNVAPTIDVTQPSSNITAVPGDVVTISWNGTDPDDAAVVTLFYDTDTNLDNGGWQLIAGGLPEDGTHHWDTTSVPLDTYYIIGVIDDGNHLGDVDQDVAPGTVTVDNAKPTIDVTQPSSNITAVPGDVVTISWNGTDPDDAAVVTLFYDTDTNLDNGGWQLIAGGLPEDGTHHWDTTSVPLDTYYIIGVIDDGNHLGDVDQDVAPGTVTVDNGIPISLTFRPPFVNATASYTETEGSHIFLRWVGAVPSDKDADSGQIHHRSFLSAYLAGASTWWVEDTSKWHFSVPKSARYKVTVKGNINGHIRDIVTPGGIDACKHLVVVGARIDGEGGVFHRHYDSLDQEMPSAVEYVALNGAKAILGAFGGPLVGAILEAADTIERLRYLADLFSPTHTFDNEPLGNRDFTFYADLQANTDYQFEFLVYGSTIGGVSGGVLFSATDVQANFTEVTIQEDVETVVGPLIQVTPEGLLDIEATTVGQSTDTMAFTVKNVGDQQLTGSVSIEPGPFEVVGGAAYNLAAKQESQISIRFFPTESGTFTRKLSFSGSQGAERYVRGEAHEPSAELSVQPENVVDLGETIVGTSIDVDAFLVVNVGGGTLTGNVSVSQPFSIVSGESYSLTHGQAQAVTVRFSPTDEGEFDSVVIFTGAGGATRSVRGEGGDVLAPNIYITNPSMDRTVSNSTTFYEFAGLASDLDGTVSNVEYRVRSGSWQTASGTMNWSLTVDLEVGPNLIEVRAKDNDGAYSEIKRRTITRQMEEKRLALINPDKYRILKFGFGQWPGEHVDPSCEGYYYSVASGTINDECDYSFHNPDCWSGVGQHPDFIAEVLRSNGYTVDEYTAANFPDVTPADYDAVIVQDPMTANTREFSRSVETDLPDLFENVAFESLVTKLENYFNAGGKLILVGDAVSLLETSAPPKYTLNFGKTILTDQVANSSSHTCVPDKWPIVRGNPFCCHDRSGSYSYEIYSTAFPLSATEISDLTLWDGHDLPTMLVWSDTIYYPADGVSLMDIRVVGSGDFVTSGSTCSPPVYSASVDDVLNHFMGYTTHNGKKIYYIGSDSFWDYHVKNYEGAWHCGQWAEIKNQVTETGKEAIVRLVQTATDDSEPIIKGDINADGNVDLADAIVALKLMTRVNIAGQDITVGADVNGDGKIGLEEVIYILQKVSGVR